MSTEASDIAPPFVSYDAEDGVYHVALEELDTLTTDIVTAVAVVAGCDPTELPPPSDVVDPDALETLFAPRENGPARDGGRVSFTYAGYDIVVDTDHGISITPL